MFSFRLEERSGGRINPETGLRPSAELFWKKYIYQGRRWARFWRILVVTIVYFLVGRFIIQSLGQPTSPFRGPVAQAFDLGLIMASVFAMLFLIFFVVDATVFCHQLVSALRRKMPPKPLADPAVATDVEAESRWPKPTLDFYAAALHVDKPYLDDWITMHFVARRTHVIARLHLLSLHRHFTHGPVAQYRVRQLEYAHWAGSGHHGQRADHHGMCHRAAFGCRAAAQRRYLAPDQRQDFAHRQG